MAKKPTHGGARLGAGRKPKTPGERRDQLFAVRVTADEKALLDDTEAGVWARELLLKTARNKRRT